MDPALFLADLEAKPEALARLAGKLRAVDPFQPSTGTDRVLLLGMGSSRYAAGMAAARLRRAGIDATADYASAPTYPPGDGLLVVAVSATGGSREVLDALSAYPRKIVITNDERSAVTEGADLVVAMHAGREAGGVACRTYQHTLALLLALVGRLTGAAADIPATIERAAAATADLLDRRRDWLPEVVAALDGPHGVYAIAPAERLCSAEQSALMIREGPRRPATGCETGDWSHVDVYLTKTLDYRALLFPGSRYDDAALEWLRERGSTVVAVGGEVPGSTATVRYAGDDDPDVALLTEVLVAELVAAAWWSAGG